MTSLTREQELALIEALGNGGLFNERQNRLKDLGLARWDAERAECLTLSGQMLAQALKERDEARANYKFMVDRASDEKLDGYIELGQKAAKAENERDEARSALALLRARIKEIQCAMHSAGYKSAAAMLNPILRGESE